MKHLRRFNESKEVNYEDLKDFCEQNLVYLLDEDRFELDVEDADLNCGEFYINFVCLNQSGTELPLRRFFRWDEIKDQFIPFLIRLKNKYGNKVTSSIHINTKEEGWRTIEIQDLIDDNTEERCRIIGDLWGRLNIEILK